jgi:hypothetical protein
MLAQEAQPDRYLHYICFLPHNHDYLEKPRYLLHNEVMSGLNAGLEVVYPHYVPTM